jgi:hypothetical protein
MPTKYSTPELSGSRPFMRRLVIGSAVFITLAAAGFFLIQENSTFKRQDRDGSNFNQAIPAQGDSTGVGAEILGEPYHFNH